MKTTITTSSQFAPHAPASIAVDGPDCEGDVFLALDRSTGEGTCAWVTLADARALRDALTEALEEAEGVKSAPEADAEKPALPPVGDLPLGYAVEVVKAFASAGR